MQEHRFFAAGGFAVRHQPPRQPDRSEREAAAAPTKKSSKAERRGAARLNAARTLFVLINLPEPSAEAVQKISGWLAGRWRIMGGTTVDVFAARIFLFRAAIQTQSSGVKAKEATASCVTNYEACGVPEGQSSYYSYL